MNETAVADKLDIAWLVIINILGLTIIATVPTYFIVYPIALFVYFIVLMLFNGKNVDDDKLQKLERRIDELEKHIDENEQNN